MRYQKARHGEPPRPSNRPWDREPAHARWICAKGYPPRWGPGDAKAAGEWEHIPNDSHRRVRTKLGSKRNGNPSRNEPCILFEATFQPITNPDRCTDNSPRTPRAGPKSFSPGNPVTKQGSVGGQTKRGPGWYPIPATSERGYAKPAPPGALERPPICDCPRDVF